jgi:biotin transporter BioY
MAAAAAADSRSGSFAGGDRGGAGVFGAGKGGFAFLWFATAAAASRWTRETARPASKGTEFLFYFLQVNKRIAIPF